MRKQMVALFSAMLVGILVNVATIAADSGTQYAGTWKGTWEGAGSGGKFDMTLASEGGKTTGGVSVGTDGGDYQAKFSTLSIDGNKLTAKYTYPLDEQGEVTLAATFEGGKWTGTWALGAKGQDGPAMANGTWTVKK